MEADDLVRAWIVDVIQARSRLIAIATRQRAKFEGWLKFELAAYAELNGASEVQVEAATDDSSGSRGDLTFHYCGERCDVELKTCNTNWRMKGVMDKTRPITKNVAAVIEDAGKLQNCSGHGIVAFCIFPVGPGDMRWTEYLSRISSGAGVQLSVDRNTTRITIPLTNDYKADVIVVSFLTAKVGLSGAAAAAQ
jgi:hypothetical protein